MENTYFSIVTNKGTEKMLQAIQSGTKVNITTFAVGDGNGEKYSPTKDMIGLKHEVWRGNVNNYYINAESENILVVETILPSDVGGFTIREMGLFDSEGDLIVICNTPETAKVKVVDGVVHEMELSIEVLLNNTNSIELIVDPTVVVAKKADVEKARIEILSKVDELQEKLETPSFDDTGIVSTIQSFADFINSVKNKMNIFEFYRNFKSGMKYILDTGRIVNNLATDRSDMVLSAAMGKYLQEQITEQNNNLNNKLKIKMFDSIDVRTLGTGNYYITNGLNMPPNFPHGYLTVQRLDDYWAFLIFQQPYGSDYQNYILKQTNGIWRNWIRVITEQDLIQTSFNLIYNGNGINQNFEFDMPVGLSKIISCDITMVSNTWEFKLYHISSFVNVNRIHFDFSADVNQVYAVRVTFGK